MPNNTPEQEWKEKFVWGVNLEDATSAQLEILVRKKPTASEKYLINVLGGMLANKLFDLPIIYPLIYPPDES